VTAAAAARAFAAPSERADGDSERLVRELSASLLPAQRREIVLALDHTDAERGLTRTFVANHWQVTRPAIASAFYTPAQQALIHAIFRSLLSPLAYPNVMRQLNDDCLGHAWGADQSIALFGDPSEGPFHFVLCGRHITLRVDGGAEPRVAFGGPVVYAHTFGSYWERPDHPGNVYWPQAVAASAWHASLPPDLAELAVVPAIPAEPPLGFRADRPGLALSLVPEAHRAALGAIVDDMMAHYRDADRARMHRCLDRQGGLAACSIQFALDGRMSAPRWDNWRLEGPSFIWHWRGFPHVHVWVHVADAPDVPVNARSGSFLLEGHDPLRQRYFAP
jgi:hypothetical protein